MTLMGLPAWPTEIFPPLTEKQRQQLRENALNRAPDPENLWIFGFGSLMWNPGFPAAERQPALLKGYMRRFHIWSTKARGTLERPGLGLCLERAEGECRGLAYRLATETRDRDLDYIWDREMRSGVYRPTWVNLTLKDGSPLGALTWVVNKSHGRYAGPMPAEQMARVMAGGEGRYGTCRDYLANTIAEMAKLGQRDALLDDVLARIDAMDTLN